jgi:hypothetical protein
VRICSITPGKAGKIIVRVYEAGHSAASGVSKNQRSSHASPRLTASERMQSSSLWAGMCTPASHFETVPCVTQAIEAISACVTPKTLLRMRRSGFMREPYSKTNYPSSRDDEEPNIGFLYASFMAKPLKAYGTPPAPPPDEVANILRELRAITEISQKQLAKIAGKSQSAVSKWGDGKHHPSKPAWDQVIAFAASDPRTAHLAHSYIYRLMGGDRDRIADLTAALVRKTP